MKKKILVADDDASIRETLAHNLTAENYVVLSAANGEEVLQIAASTPIDLVLLDLNMPVKNGWDTFEQLTFEHPLLPVIIVTGRPNQLFPALAGGAGALMEKPLDLPKLIHAIADLISEPAEARLARLAGKPADFHYQPTPGKSALALNQEPAPV